jgi:hypothetical protein
MAMIICGRYSKKGMIWAMLDGGFGNQFIPASAETFKLVAAD